MFQFKNRNGSREHGGNSHQVARHTAEGILTSDSYMHANLLYSSIECQLSMLDGNILVTVTFFPDILYPLKSSLPFGPRPQFFFVSFTIHTIL